MTDSLPGTLAKYTGVLVFFLVPFLGGNDLSLPLVTIDRFWIEAMFLLVLIAAVAFQLLRRVGESKGSASPDRGFIKFMVYAGPFIALSAMSLVYTWNRFSTLKELNVLVWVVGSVYVLHVSGERDTLIKALLVGVCLSATAAILQFLVVFPGLAETVKMGKEAALLESRAIPFGPFLYHNVLGGYLASLLPLLLYYGALSNKRSWMFSLGTVLVIAGLVLTTSRFGIATALLGLAGVGAITALRRDVKGLVLTAAIVMVAVVSVLVMVRVMDRNGVTDVSSIMKSKVVEARVQVKTVNTRTEIWKTGLKAFAREPILGHGAGTFEYASRPSYSGGVYTQFAHSTFLKIAVELGALGLAAFFFFLVGLMVVAREHLKGDREKYAAFALALAFAFGAVDFAFDAPAYVVTFFVLAALLVGSREEKTDKAPAEKPSRGGLFAVLVVAFLILSLLFSVRANLSDKSVSNGRLYEDAGMPRQAYESYREAIQEMPFNNEGYVKAMSILIAGSRAVSETSQKEEFLWRLRELRQIAERNGDRDSGLFFCLGMAYDAIGVLDKAEQQILHAIALYPASAQYVYEGGLFYVRNGQPEKAAALLSTIEQYATEYRLSRNPKGLFFYRIRDLRSQIVRAGGDFNTAQDLLRQNIEALERDDFVTSDPRTGDSIGKERLLKHLRAGMETFDGGAGRNSGK